MYALLPIFGLFGCRGDKKYTVDEIVLINTVHYGMERNPVYSFVLQKKEDGWFFSAECMAGNRKEHYTSFDSFPIPTEEADGFLEIIREEKEIGRLRKYRNPKQIFQICDAPMRRSRMTFTDGKRIDKETSLGGKALNYLYALANRHYEEAESVEVTAVFICSNCMDHSSSYSFTLEKNESEWYFSFDAVIDCSGVHTEMEKQRIDEIDAQEILRVVKKQQLVTKVRQYKELPEDSIFVLDKTTYKISFDFADGSSIYAPTDAGNELTDAFYTLAKQCK